MASCRRAQHGHPGRHRQQHADRAIRGVLLVLLSLVIAPAPLSLAFSGVEVFLVLMATFVASILIVDGKSTWFTGVQL